LANGVVTIRSNLNQSRAGVAGQELTHREATRNGAEAAALEALVTVGLYLLRSVDPTLE
jgi:hypothetical protein